MQDDWARTPSTSQAWQTLDDPELKPIAPGGGDYIDPINNNDATAVELETQSLNAEVVNDGQAWFYASTGPSTELRVEVIWNGQSQVERTLGTGKAAGWRSVDLGAVLPTSQAAVDSLRFRFKAVGGHTSRVHAAYFFLHTAALGFNEHHFVNHPDPNRPPPSELMNLASATLGPGAMMRFTVDWRVVQESGPTQWSWTIPDLAYNAIVAAGGKPLPVVLAAPFWARHPMCQGGVCPPDPDNYLDEWATFSGAVAKRYPASAALEIWNEPNLKGSWNTTTGPDGAEYAGVFNSAATAFEAERPAIPVLYGGLAHGSASPNVPEGDFLDDFYGAADRTLLQQADGLSLHPYEYAGPSPLLANARDALTRNSDSGRGLWVTEFGFKTAGTFAESEAVQSMKLLAQMDSLTSQPDIEAALIHRLVDPAPNASGAEQGLGLLRYRTNSTGPHTPKVAFCALTAHEGRPPPGLPLVTPPC